MAEIMRKTVVQKERKQHICCHKGARIDMESHFINGQKISEATYGVPNSSKKE